MRAALHSVVLVCGAVPAAAGGPRGVSPRHRRLSRWRCSSWRYGCFRRGRSLHRQPGRRSRERVDGRRSCRRGDVSHRGGAAAGQGAEAAGRGRARGRRDGAAARGARTRSGASGVCPPLAQYRRGTSVCVRCARPGREPWTRGAAVARRDKATGRGAGRVRAGSDRRNWRRRRGPAQRKSAEAQRDRSRRRRAARSSTRAGTFRTRSPAIRLMGRPPSTSVASCVVGGYEVDADRPLRVAAAAPDRPVRYLAMMFLGAIAERRSQYADAERLYLASARGVSLGTVSVAGALARPDARGARSRRPRRRRAAFRRDRRARG